jgi:DNA-directed RNA polymerase subunit RPC12/RpoP
MTTCNKCASVNVVKEEIKGCEQIRCNACGHKVRIVRPGVASAKLGVKGTGGK